MYCPNCEFEIKQEVTECPICGGELTQHPEETPSAQPGAALTEDIPFDLSISNLILDAKQELDALDSMPAPAPPKIEPEPECLNLEALLSQDTDENMFEFRDAHSETPGEDTAHATTMTPDFFAVPEDAFFRKPDGTPPNEDASADRHLSPAEIDISEQPFILDDSLFIDETAPQPETQDSAPFIDEAGGKKLASALDAMVFPPLQTEAGPDLLFGRGNDELETDRIDFIPESQQQSDVAGQDTFPSKEREKAEFSLDAFAETPEPGGQRSTVRLVALALLGVVIIACAYFLTGYFLQQPEPPAQIAKPAAPAVRKKAKQPVQKPEPAMPEPEVAAEKTAPASQSDRPDTATTAAPPPVENAAQQAEEKPVSEPLPAPPVAELTRTTPATEKPAPQKTVEPAQDSAAAATPAASAPAMPAAPDKKPTPAPGVFSVHVFSFKTQQSAQNEIERLNKRGFNAYLETVDLGAKGIWHRVKVGKYATRSEADQARLDIKKKYPGVEPLININK